MLFLADECCDALIVQTLRTLGHNVTFIAEFAPGVNDVAVLTHAYNENRILITEDRDFCELIFRDGKLAYGVVLVRIPALQRQQKAQRITALITLHGTELSGKMATLTLTNMKIRPLPGNS